MNRFAFPVGLALLLVSSGPLIAESSSPTESETPPARSEVPLPVTRGPVIDGEPFTVRQILDPEQGGLAVNVFIAPQSWRDRSQVTWNYAHTSNPVTASATVENPANDEAFFLHPSPVFYSLRPDAGLFRPGQNSLGLIYWPQPLPPAQVLLKVVRPLREGFGDFTIVGQKDLPELAKALQVPGSAHQRGVGLKVTYRLKDKLIEEEFYGVFDSIDIPFDGPQGRSWQVNWGIGALHSFRAAAGTLEKRRPVFAAIAKSFRPNPAWQQRLAAVNAYLADQFNRQMQAGYDAIAAAGALSRQISANNDAMIAAIDRQLAAASAGAGATSTGRSATDKFNDYLRGVDTVNDPYYGTSQHANTETYHWTDGYGSYRHSNDPHADPNRTEAGNWQLMEPAR